MSAEPNFAIALAKTSNKKPYTKELNETIRNSREQLGQLFFDVLLKELTDLDSTYPPRDNESLHLLLQKIDETSIKTLNKACLNYYLFLDFRVSEDDDLAGYYASEIDMPQGYREMVHGLWHLDRLQFDDALPKLCHPEVSSHFADKIIHAYMTLAPEDTRAHQTITYIQSTTPQLVNSVTIESYIKTLCSTSLYAALEFARAASEDTRVQMLETIVKSAFQLDPKRNVWRLANLPLSVEETELLNREVLLPLASQETNTKEASLARDVVMMRALHTGNVDLARQVTKMGDKASGYEAPLAKSGGAPHNNVAWSDISRGLSLSK